MCLCGIALVLIFLLSEYRDLCPSLLQKGDLLLNINGVSLLNKTHSEAIHLIKSVMSSSSVRLDLIQGEGSRESGGLSPDWEKWVKKHESASSGPQR